MKEINLDNIKEKTYTKIGCSNFIKEDTQRTKIKKILVNTLITLLFLSTGLFTVNAATNNGLVNMIKKIAKLNNKDYEVIIYDVPSHEYYSEVDGRKHTTTPITCLRIPTNKNDDSKYDEICYPLGTTFEDIELYYDKKSHITGYHITGYKPNGEYFEDNWDIKDDEK